MLSRTSWEVGGRAGKGQPTQKPIFRLPLASERQDGVPQDLCLHSSPSPPDCSRQPLDCQEEVTQRKETACCVLGAVWASWLLTEL